MSLPIYPDKSKLPGKGFSSKWSPRFFNQTSVSSSGANISAGLAQYPLHSFELTYNFLRDGVQWGSPNASLEFRTMMGFYLSVAGTVGRFLFRNPDDNTVFQNEIGVGDGTTTTFVLTRSFGGGGFFAVEPVGQVSQTDPFNVYLGGSYAPVDPATYTVSIVAPVANLITFATAPAAGQVIRVDMSFYYYCGFDADTYTFEKFADRLWMLQKITLASQRPGA